MYISLKKIKFELKYNLNNIMHVSFYYRFQVAVDSEMVYFNYLNFFAKAVKPLTLPSIAGTPSITVFQLYTHMCVDYVLLLLRVLPVDMILT